MHAKCILGWGLLGSLAGCPNPSNDAGDRDNPTASSDDAEFGPEAAADGRSTDGNGRSECITACIDSGVVLAHVGLDGAIAADVGGTAAAGVEGGAGTDPRGDASEYDASGTDALNDPLNLAARCTSGVMWNGVTGDQNMAPGEACPTCHSNYYLAGTLYPTGHEPNGCGGVNGLTTAVTVQVTEATGNVITLYANAAGNFYTSISITPPYQAKVVLNGSERAMISAQTNLSCNACHTQTGTNGAPGRVTVPP